MRTTQRLLVGLAAGTSLPMVAALALLSGVAASGCPQRPPAPPMQPPGPADCATACNHANQVCPGSGEPCDSLCPREPAEYPACVNVATGCDALNACDSPGKAAAR